MIKIKFTNEEIMREVSLSMVGNHVVEIVGLDEPNLTGFETFRYADNKKLGDFSDFTTLFRTVDGGYQFSNDGSIYPYIPDPTTPEKVAKLQTKVSTLETTTSTLTEVSREMGVEVIKHDTEIANTQDAICQVTEDTAKTITDLENAICEMTELLLNGGTV